MPARAKEVFQEVQQEKKYFLQLLDAVEDALFSMDHDGKVAWMNKAAERLAGESLRKFHGKPFAELPVDGHLKEIWTRFLGGERIRNLETCITPHPAVGKAVHGAGLPEAPPCAALISCFTLADGGRLQGGLLFVQDVSEVRRHARDRLQKDSVHALAGLTASLAHEIKNPLGAIDLHIQLLQRLLKNAHFPGHGEMDEMARVISEEIHRLDRIVNEFLTSVRPIRARRKPESLNPILEEVLRLMAPELEARKVRVVADLAPDLPLLLLDRDLIKQAVINLIKNAQAAMENTGRPGLLKVGTRHAGETVLLSVADNGEGLPAENLAKIFEPFFTTREMGTGLGLTIVHRIFTEHGGELVLQSEPGQGTDFRVEFPLHEAAPRLLASPPAR